jgi:hypothetical protein
VSTEHEEPRLGCDLPLGRPGLIAHNELVLSGWATSPLGISGVAVQIGDRQWNASYGLDAPEAAHDAPPRPAEAKGYELRVDTSSWTPGPCYVTIAAFDLEGGRSAIEGTVEIRPFEQPGRSPEENLARIEAGRVAMSLDAPRILDGAGEVEEPVEILGWAHAKGGIEAVVVTVDGCRQHEALRPVVRPDLMGDYGPEVAFDAGFVSRLHGSECEPGRHSVSVVALGENGEAVGVAGEVVCRPTPSDTEKAAVQVAWRDDLEEPRRRESTRDPERPETAWEDRALLAEADAAESRAEARLVFDHQRSFARTWRGLEAKARGFDALEAELWQARAELEQSREELEQRAVELERSRAELAGVERSLSWRLTAPLRAIKRFLAKGARRGA